MVEGWAKEAPGGSPAVWFARELEGIGVGSHQPERRLVVEWA